MKWIRIVLAVAVAAIAFEIWVVSWSAGAHSTITLERHDDGITKLEAQLPEPISEMDRIHLTGPGDFLSGVLHKTKRISVLSVIIALLAVFGVITEFIQTRKTQNPNNRSQDIG